MDRRTFLKSSAATAAAGLLPLIVPPRAGRAQSGPGGRQLAPPVAEGRWIRPAKSDAPARPLWGHANGMRVGIVPPGGPRGLLRIYTPYLGHDADRLLNYIAVEPIPAGQPQRGLSELEPSKLDGGVRGKRFWSADDPADPTPSAPERPSRGVIETAEGGAETLRVFVNVEGFDNGAHVYVRLTFRSDRPRAVGLAAFTRDDSAPLDHCVLTATMGNYARLRRLHLANGMVVTSTQLWPEYRGDAFTPHAKFPLAELTRTPEGHAIVSATPDERDPQNAEYAPGTRHHWRYTGKVATQTWRSETPSPDLQAWVNGRHAYWASRHPIPGGVSFENFELFTPFRQGEEFWFEVEPGVPG
jgi:hypothetical protein